MPGLVGLAFTSPSIAVMVINRSLFRVHLYQNRPSDLHSFLQEADYRLPVVLVDGVSNLKRLSTIEGVHAFLVTDDPAVLHSIEGAIVPDAEPDSSFSGYRKLKITPEELNAALLSVEQKFVLGDAESKIDDLSDDISFQEVLSMVTTGFDLGEDFVKNVCSYLVGIIHRKSWVSRVQKPALAAGVPVERMAELEKFIESTPSAEMLWRAFYSHVESGVPLEDAASQLEATSSDLHFLVSVLGTDKPSKWVKNPNDKPLVLRKKRRVRKLKRNHFQGTSMTVTSSPSDASFDLLSCLSRIDAATGSDDFSRSASAFLCGLTNPKVFGQAKRKASSLGAGDEDLAAVTSFAKEDPHAQNLWKAFCYHSYCVGVTTHSAAKKFDIPVFYLAIVLSYKPLAFAFDWPSWPEELE